LELDVFVNSVTVIIFVGRCANLIAKFPFISFAAMVVLCVGVGLFCGGGFTALQIVLWGIFDGLFHFHIPWYGIS
jgi:Myelin proteolipid protein (PLP or lipophilin)